MGKMVISEIKAKRVFAGPGNYAVVAEAEVFDDDTGESVYVSVQKYDGSEYAVSKESVYAFLADGGDEPAGTFLEEYVSAQEAKTSAYAKVFDILKKTISALG